MALDESVRDTRSRWRQLRTSLTRSEWATLGGMSAFVLFLHVLGWGTLIAIVAPHHYQTGLGSFFGIGLGITAYGLGMRHAFDADHIAVIDNTTRKLMQDGKRPLSVGLWFSLGHSSVVFLLCLLLAAGVRTLAGQIENDSSTLQTTTGLIGSLVSGIFLYLIGLINLMILVGIVKMFRGLRRNEYDDDALNEQLAKRGIINRILGRVANRVREPWHIYPVAFLFGLGFDTATEVSLLVLAGGAAAYALPWYAILTLPVLFAAGMSLFDTVDGCFMNFAYGWALSNPVRKIYFNMTVTALSVGVALVIGTIELIGILVEKTDITSGPLAYIGGLDLNYVGYAIVALFAVTWIVALAIWRFGRIEQRFSRVAPTDTTAVPSETEGT